MANERDQAQEDDFLDDLNLDDVDLDALLEEDESENAAKKTPASESRGPTERTVNDGDGAEEDGIDFADLDLDEADEITFPEEPPAMESGSAGSKEAGGREEFQELSEEDLFAGEDLLADEGPQLSAAGEPPKSEGDIPGFDDDSDDDEEIDFDALLDESDSPADAAGDEGGPPPIPGAAASPVSFGADELGLDGDALLSDESGADDDADVLRSLEDELVQDGGVEDDAGALEAGAIVGSAASALTGKEREETEELPAEEKKGRKGKTGKKVIGKGLKGKGRTGKTSRIGRDRKDRKPARGRKTARRAKPEKKPRPAAVASVRGSVRFICSECYEEFLLPSSYSSETVTCPECLHVGKRPDDDFLRTVHIHKTGERKSFAAVTLVGMLLVVELMFMIWMHSPYCNLDIVADEATKKNMTLGLLGGGGILTILFLWLLTRFESNRWEVYF